MTLLRLYWIAPPAGANLIWRNLAPTNGAAAMTMVNHIDPGRAEPRHPKPDYAALLKRITDVAFSAGEHAE
jgi:hypothetical protein